jgi:hypothetical protein
MRQPPTGSRFPTSCENDDVIGDKTLLAFVAQASDETPPATTARKPSRP